VIRWLAGASLLMGGLGAAACPLCGDSQGFASPQEFVARAGPVSTTRGGAPPDIADLMRDPVPTQRPNYRLDRETAASAVLALPGDERGRLKVVEVIRGELPAGAMIEPTWVIGLDRNVSPSAKPLLLIRARNWQSWAVVGAIGREHAGWLRLLAATAPTTGRTEAEWQTAAAFVLPYLENADPLVAEIAYAELARAPYATLRTLRGRLDLMALRRWTADPQLSRRRSLYTLLVGVGGDATDSARIDQQLNLAWKAKDATNLGPMLAASLELHGPSRMAWVDARYMRDRDRTLQELQATLLALNVQGDANATIPRERVIESYRTFIDVHKEYAGFVAQDLVAWRCWDVGPEYIALLRSDLEQHPASRFAMLSYLRQSPRADARAAVAALANAGAK
jgi:hypothetical protein